MTPSFAIAVKAFIVKDGKLFLAKRNNNAPHEPGAWELPGGRLEPGEDPFNGLEREVAEETGMRVTIKNPLRVHSFRRDDGQQITMIVFWCEPEETAHQLSDEHTSAKWVPIAQAKELLVGHFHLEVDLFQKHFSSRA